MSVAITGLMPSAIHRLRDGAGMFGLLAYMWSSAVVTGLLGTLPGRSLRFRVTIVALVLSLFSVLSFSVAEFWVRPLFEGTTMPEEVIPGEWALLGIYAPVATQMLGLLFMVAVAYFLRRGLLPPGEKDTRTRKVLVLAAALARIHRRGW